MHGHQFWDFCHLKKIFMIEVSLVTRANTIMPVNLSTIPLRIISPIMLTDSTDYSQIQN